MDPKRRMSHLPVPAAGPSTIKKPTASSNSRMSLAGSAQRAPPPSASQPRHSIMRSQNSNNNPLLQSVRKPNPGQTPLNSSTRRGSIWPGTSQASSSQPTGSQTVKDPRPLREKHFQSKMRNDIIGWLHEGQYDIHPETLKNITGKEFQNISLHLVNMANHQVPEDADFITALTVLRYPFIKQLDPKWMAAPASMHSWPYLLGALHWIVELGQAMGAYLRSDDPTLLNPDPAPEHMSAEWGPIAQEYDYCQQIYQVWLMGANEFPDQNAVLKARYDKKDAKVQAEVDEMRRKFVASQARVSAMEKEQPPLQAVAERVQTLAGDRLKFETYLKKYEQGLVKLNEQNAKIIGDNSNRELEIERLTTEQARLQSIVEEQNLTPEQVRGMNTQHEQLRRNLMDLESKTSEAQSAVMTLEVNVTNVGAAAEDAIGRYEHLCASLSPYIRKGVSNMDTPTMSLDGDALPLSLGLNTAAANLHELLVGPDIRTVVKPALWQVAENTREQRERIETARIKVDDELDRLTTECENAEEEISALENKVTSINDQADDMRDNANEAILEDKNKTSRMQRELANARNAAMAIGKGVKSRLHAVQYKEQVDKYARLREETLRAVVRAAYDIQEFKTQAQKNLLELEEVTMAS